jgi:hypothetical protein
LIKLKKKQDSEVSILQQKRKRSLSIDYKKIDKFKQNKKTTRGYCDKMNQQLPTSYINHHPCVLIAIFLLAD